MVIELPQEVFVELFKDCVWKYLLKETNFTGPTSFVWLARKKHIVP